MGKKAGLTEEERGQIMATNTLTHGCFTWHHNQVLLAVTKSIIAFRLPIVAPMLINQESVHQRVVYFLGEGASQFARNRCRAKRKHFLKNTNDWPMLRHYPQVLAESDMRVDAVLSSTRADMFILVKLMVPWEDRMGLSTIQKEDKYLDLIIDLKQRGYKVWFFAIEVGARGLVS